VQLIIEPDRSSIKLEGPFDRRTSPEIRKKLLRVIRQESPHEVEIDLSGVSSMDTAGVAVLVEVLKSVSETGGELRLTGLNKNAARIIHLARLDQVFKITQNVG
jgi:anti-sigma B factor antagonist